MNHEGKIVKQKPKIQRKQISKKTRFEVFKRDSFTCQYCGRVSPDVVLHIDHIKPVKDGGNNDILNYITSCLDCNLGKGSRSLSDHQVLNKQRKQLLELNERREQLKMMVEWKEELEKMSGEEVAHILNLIRRKTGHFNLDLSEKGNSIISGAIRKYGFNEIYESANIAVNQYYDDSHESIDKVIRYTPRIANIRVRDTNEPYMKDLYYIRGILNNRLVYCNKFQAIKGLKEAYLEADASIEDLKNIALTARNWTNFKIEMQDRYEVII